MGPRPHPEVGWTRLGANLQGLSPRRSRSSQSSTSHVTDRWSHCHQAIPTRSRTVPCSDLRPCGPLRYGSPALVFGYSDDLGRLLLSFRPPFAGAVPAHLDHERQCLSCDPGRLRPAGPRPHRDHQVECRSGPWRNDPTPKPNTKATAPAGSPRSGSSCGRPPNSSRCSGPPRRRAPPTRGEAVQAGLRPVHRSSAGGGRGCGDPGQADLPPPPADPDRPAPGTARPAERTPRRHVPGAVEAADFSRVTATVRHGACPFSVFLTFPEDHARP